MSTFTDKVKTNFKDLILFLTSSIFIKNAGLALFLIIGLILITFQSLKWHTRSGSSITVPNFEGLTLDQIDDLKIKKLKIVIADSSTYKSEKLPLEVLQQEPPANTKVKKNRTIYVNVNKIQPTTKSVPAIWGKQVDLAQNQLRKAGFKYAIVEERPDKATNTVLEVRYKGKKIDQSELINLRLPMDSKIELVVASGLGSVITIPDLVCLPYDQAMAIISGSQLNVGTVKAIGVQDTFNAYIVRQYPIYNPRGIMNQGDEIDLTLSPTPLPRCTVDSTFIVDPTIPKKDTTLRIRTSGDGDMPTEF